jgi:hypothetical protein
MLQEGMWQQHNRIKPAGIPHAQQKQQQSSGSKAVSPPATAK